MIPPVHNDPKGTPPLGFPTSKEIDAFRGYDHGRVVAAVRVLVGRGRSIAEARKAVLEYLGRVTPQTSTGGWCGDDERAFLDALFTAPERSSE